MSTILLPHSVGIWFLIKKNWLFIFEQVICERQDWERSFPKMRMKPIIIQIGINHSTHDSSRTSCLLLLWMREISKGWFLVGRHFLSSSRMEYNWKINLPQSPILTNDIKLSKQAPSKPEEGISSSMIGNQRNVSHDKIWMKSVLRINFHQIRNQLLNTS